LHPCPTRRSSDLQDREDFQHPLRSTNRGLHFRSLRLRSHTDDNGHRPDEKGASSGVKKHSDNSRNPRSPLRGIRFSRFFNLLSKTNERAHHRTRKQVTCATEKIWQNRDYSTVHAGHHGSSTAPPTGPSHPETTFPLPKYLHIN